MNKQLPLVAAVSLACGLPLTAQADVIAFDGNADGTSVQVDVFDFNPGNVLSDNSVPLSTGSTFTVYGQSALQATQFGGLQNNDPGLNSTYEVTMVFAFTEQATNVIDTNLNGFNDLAIFSLANGTNYFEIWSSPINHNDLTGSGFNDGTLILSGTIVAAAGNFQVNESTVPDLGGTAQQYDQFLTDGNNYPGTLSVQGAGNTLPFTVQVNSFNSAYFPGLNPATLLSFSLDLLNTSQNAPFLGVDPSNCFIDTAGGTAVSSCDTTFGNVDPTAINPVVGAINGISGPDFQFQTDYNMVASTRSIPEPGTLALLGMGLGFLGLGKARRRRMGA